MTGQVGVVQVGVVQEEEGHTGYQGGGGDGSTYRHKDRHSQHYEEGVDSKGYPTDHTPATWGVEGVGGHMEGRGNNRICLGTDFGLVLVGFYVVSPPQDIADCGTERDRCGGDEGARCHGDYRADGAKRRRRSLHDVCAAYPLGLSAHSVGDHDDAVGKGRCHSKTEDVDGWGLASLSHLLRFYTGGLAHHLIWYNGTQVQNIIKTGILCSFTYHALAYRGLGLHLCQISPSMPPQASSQWLPSPSSAGAIPPRI